jgi:probable HAF family extracellular repeat protein
METPPRFAARSAYVARDEALLLRLPGLSWLTPFLVSLLLCAGLALTPAQTEAAYAATELASLPAGSSHVVRAANDADEIVGSARRGGGRGHRGFLLKSGPLQEIGGLPGSDYSAALGINDLGQVVGSANTATGMRAFRSRRTTGIVALATLPGDSSSIAFAINRPGQAVGYSSGPTGVRAVIWTPAGAIQALPMLPGCDSARGLALNDGGDVVGACDTVSGPRAVLWEGGAVQDLSTLPGHGSSEALSINANGVIVGSSGDPEAQRHAVLWPSGGGPIQDLGTLPDGTSSQALAINIRREVVGISEASAGDHAFLWTEPDGMQDLNGLVTSRFGFVLTHAVAISAQGVIVAVGVDEATTPEQRHDHDDHELPLRIFRLVPVP